jgi:MtrB/PioB family decaheme-associated outer membrane protein
MKQKNTVPMPRRNLVLAVSAALASLAAAPAFADPLLTIKLFRDSEVMFRDADMSRWAENYVELGVGYNSQDSLRFGQFSGLTKQGGFPLAGVNWISRSETNDAQYWQIHGANLGLDSRKIKAEGGVQGQWEASFSFDGLKKSQTDSARFIHQGLGTSNLTYTATVANPTLLNQALLQPFNIQQGRDIYRLGLKGLLGNEWDFKVNYREDRRDGTRLTGFATSSLGGTPAFIVPYQIDDKTQQIEAVLAYATKLAQFQVGYTYSKFSNALTAFNVQSPFTGVNANNRMSLAPDNDYHQISATGAYNISKTTRLSATYSRGIASQNEAFLPFSANGAAATAALPRSSLDGKVVNTLLDVALTAKPIDKMNVKLGYQYRDNDNRTPIARFQYAQRDGAAVGLVDSVSDRTNAPVSTKENKATLEADYEIAPKTVLRAGLEHSNKKYTLTDRTDTQTNKLSVELRKPVADDFLGSLGYAYTQRRGSNYDKGVFFRNTYSTNYQNNTVGLTNHPSMRSFMYADYDENRLRTAGNWTLSETLSLQGVIDGYQQKFRKLTCNQFNDANQSGVNGITAALADTCLGRDSAEGGSVSLDLQYQPEENLTTFAFANLSQSRIKQIGRTWTRPGVTGALDNKNWYGDMVALDGTLGFGLKWQPEEKWDVGGTYIFNHGIGKSGINQEASTNTTVIAASQALPDTWSKLHTLQLFAKWDHSKQLSWRFNYLYENLRSYDWALSDVGPVVSGLTSVLLTGQQAPRYSNHVFGVSAVVKSW